MGKIDEPIFDNAKLKIIALFVDKFDTLRVNANFASSPLLAIDRVRETTRGRPIPRPGGGSLRFDTAQQEDPSISLVMQQLSSTNTKAEGDEKVWEEKGELRRYRQLLPQMEIMNGILHRRVDKGSPKERVVLVVPQKCVPTS